MATPESKVKAKVKEWLRAKGVFFFMPANNGMGVSGIPDFICCLDGYFLGIETKAPGRKSATTPIQKLRHEEIRAAGGLAIVVDDVTQLDDAWEQVYGKRDNSETTTKE